MSSRPAPAPVVDPEAILARARLTFDIEAEAVLGLKSRIGPSFVEAVHKILGVRGRVVVMGMGKSGHVGRKIAATLASTGTPAMFVHPAEASHGDLGMVTPQDLVLAISNSGESEELSAILPVLKRLGVTLVAITGRGESTLARHAEAVLDSAVALEACPLNLAPTASTTSWPVIMPRSPWLASAGWTNMAGVPVEARVAAILRPMWPLLPMPITTTRPRHASINLTASANSGPTRPAKP